MPTRLVGDEASRPGNKIWITLVYDDVASKTKKTDEGKSSKTLGIYTSAKLEVVLEAIKEAVLKL